MKPTLLRMSQAQAEAAAQNWGFNCGPAALCAVLDMTPDELQPHLLDFESKGYMNPTLMLDVLKGLKIPHRIVHRSDDFSKITVYPEFGLCRVQWHGPWTKPGVPMRVRYRKTHWIAVYSSSFQRTIFDVNAMSAGGWIWSKSWETNLVPWLIKACVPKADGRWHITHSIELKACG